MTNVGCSLSNGNCWPAETAQHKYTSLLIQASIEVLLRYLLVRASAPMTHAFKFLSGNEHRHRHVYDKKQYSK
jgi:hypothetical protein